VKQSADPLRRATDAIAVGRQAYGVGIDLTSLGDNLSLIAHAQDGTASWDRTIRSNLIHERARVSNALQRPVGFWSFLWHAMAGETRPTDVPQQTKFVKLVADRWEIRVRPGRQHRQVFDDDLPGFGIRKFD